MFENCAIPKIENREQNIMLLNDAPSHWRNIFSRRWCRIFPKFLDKPPRFSEISPLLVLFRVLGSIGLIIIE